MKVRILRAVTASCVLAIATAAMAQAAHYEDGSEADVYYYSAHIDDAGAGGDEASQAETADDGATASDAPSEALQPTAALAAHEDTQPYEEQPYEDAYEDAYEPGITDPSSFTYGGNSCGAAGNGCCTNSHDDCCSCGACCNPYHGFWARGEYLMWWMSGATAPPLVTTSPTGTPITDAGVLPDAEILFPTEELGIDGRPGGRFTLGYWFNDAETWGVEGSYFILDKGGDGIIANSDNDGSPILARPFIDAATGLEDSFIVAYDDVFAGGVTVASASDVMGAEVNVRHSMLGNRWCKMDLLAGYRFLKVNESLSIYQNQTSIDPGGVIPLDTQISIQDDFVTRNSFHGGQVGMILQKEHRRWTFEGTGKVAFGSWNQQVRIGGFTSVAVPGQPIDVQEGGLLALASNSGNYERDRFVAIPEFGMNLRYQLTRSCKVSVGYTFLYLSRIARPGNNIDRQIDTDQLPPPIGPGAFPEFTFKESDAWLQGVNVGLECRF